MKRVKQEPTLYLGEENENVSIVNYIMCILCVIFERTINI